MDPIIIILIVLVYIAGLFLFAAWGEKKSALQNKYVNNGLIYSLSLAVYATSWTFYGSIGKAANSGLIFLTVYIGPTLSLLLWRAVLLKFVRIKSKYHITSIADFISARYNKSAGIAFLASLTALLGIMPYISLQIKSIFSTFRILSTDSSPDQFWAGRGFEFLIIGGLIVFIISFGIRRLDPTARHPGIILVLAFESLVKIFAFLAAGIFVTFILYDGFDDIFTRMSDSGFKHILGLGDQNNFSITQWITYLVLSMSAIFFLPRQFHVAVIENSDENHLRTASWAFPLYLLIINIFVMPIAAAGLLLGFSPESADTFLLAIPLLKGELWLGLLVFIGGFSAAAGMIMISTMTLSTMVTNHLVIPVINKAPVFLWIRRHLLFVKWSAAAIIIISGYLFEVFVSESEMLVSIGMISFAAVLQFAPAVIGGICWKKANTGGALLGLTAGLIVWFYTLLLPAFLKGSGFGLEILGSGPWGIELLKPEQLLGLTSIDSLSSGVFWSMFFNTGLFLLGSALLKQGRNEKQTAEEFTDILSEKIDMSAGFDSRETVKLASKKKILLKILLKYFDDKIARDFLNQAVNLTGLEGREQITVLELTKLRSQVEMLLAGSIGAAAAFKAVRTLKVFNKEEAKRLSESYSRIISELRLTPEELKSKIDFYKERDQLLSEHAKELELKVKELDQQIQERMEIQAELDEYRNHLEKLVEVRAEELVVVNKKLQAEINERKAAEEQLKLFSHAIVQSPAAIMITDPDGSIEYVNPKFTEISGYSAVEILGENPRVLKSGMHDQEFYKELWKTISSGNEWRGKIQNRRKNGELFWEFSSISSINNEQDQITHYLAVKEDITERIQLENRMALSQKLESVGQLAAGIAHEINTPLQYIGDNISFLQDAYSSMNNYFIKVQKTFNEFGAGIDINALIKELQQTAEDEDLEFLTSEVHPALDQSAAGVQKVRKIVLAMKDFAHPGTSDKSMFDINKGIGVTIDISRNNWRYAANLEFEPEEELPLIYCDGDEINQVILNLIINAAHAIEDQSGKGSSDKGEIKISTKNLDSGVEITVEDTGKGISEENQAKIFDPFFTTKDVGKGTGQGLAIVHDIIVNKHKGSIEVKSKPGKGTVFSIFIPNETDTP